MDFLQELIHKLEVGGGMKSFRWFLLILVGLLFIVGYNERAFKNLATQEAMDSGQLARNLAQGKGYTTFFIRPFSMFLLKRHALEKQGAGSKTDGGDLYRIKGAHPDLANPPVYPCVLAGLMKLLAFDYAATAAKPFWSNGGAFCRYQPDFIISAFNQLLLLITVGMVYLLARRLFNPQVAVLSALLVFGTELFWRFSVSGLSTTLLMLLVLALAWTLVLLEEEVREPRGGRLRPLALALLAGLLTGLGGLTRYSFAWLILPVLLFIVLFAGQRRVLLALVGFLAFAGVTTPWVVRNYGVSGTPFGTAGYSLLEMTGKFTEHRLERSLEPDSRKSIWVGWFGISLRPTRGICSSTPCPK